MEYIIDIANGTNTEIASIPVKGELKRSTDGTSDRICLSRSEMMRLCMTMLYWNLESRCSDISYGDAYFRCRSSRSAFVSIAFTDAAGREWRYDTPSAFAERFTELIGRTCNFEEVR